MFSRLAKWSDSHELTRRGRRWLADAPGVARVVSARDRRRLRRLEAEGNATERSKERWRHAPPELGLTWGEQVSGEPAVEAAERHGVYGPDRLVVEIGPGYGRILGAALRQGVEFRRYVGVDLSEENVGHLRANFDDPRVEILCGDAETFQLDEPIDSVYSFLTFKHIYPSFAAALGNLGSQLRPGGRIVFDLIEGPREYFHRDERTFMREYTREEVSEIVSGASLELVEFDQVVHAPGRTRLLVVVTKPADG
jgi:SAM-dependent methyltransferase